MLITYLVEMTEKRIEVKIDQKISTPSQPANEKPPSPKLHLKPLLTETPKNQGSPLPANMQNAVKRVLPVKASTGKNSTDIEKVIEKPSESSSQAKVSICLFLNLDYKLIFF